MRRRDFIALAGGAAAAWPLGTLAQTAKVYRLGTLTPGLPLSSTADRGAVLFAGLAKPAAKLREKFLYQNVMYTAAGEVAARANSMAWEQLVTTRILQPLGMTSTAFGASVRKAPATPRTPSVPKSRLSAC